MHRLAILTVLVFAVGLSAPPPAEGAASAAADGKVRVFVSILPQAWFVERVGGPHVAVDVLVGPGQSPHTFEPTPKEIARLAEAQVYFRIGWPFEERLLGKVSAINPRLRVVDTREGIPLRRMTEAEVSPEEPGGHADEDHKAGAPDPHFWLSPRLAGIMAATLAQAIEQVDPAHADEYRANLKSLQADLDALDARLAKALAPLKGKAFFVYHPAFGYFADAYGLVQAPAEIEGKEPTARQLAALIDRAKAAHVRVIFVQPQFSAKSAEALAGAIGGAVVRMDDLARDYIPNMTDMADKIQKALGAKS